MKKIALLLSLLSSTALAQTNPNWQSGYVPPPSEWNNLWSSKADVTNGTLIAPSISGLPVSAGNVTLRAPKSTDDAAHGYNVNDMWLFGNDVYIALKTTIGEAVWQVIPAAHALPIDAIGGVAPVFAYGTIKLASGFGGNSFNAIRTSDSAALDIPFVTTANGLNLAVLDAFSPGITVRVATWYDQSGNVNNATAIAANRPAVSSSNVIGTTRSVVFDTTHASSTGPAFTGMAIPSAGAATAGAISFITLMRLVNNLAMFPIELTGTNTVWGGYAASSPVFVLNRTAGQIKNIAHKPYATPEVYAFSLAFGSSTLVIGNQQLTTASGSGVSTALTSATLGSSVSAATSGGLEMIVALGYARQLSTSEMTNGIAAIYRESGVTPQVRDNLMVVGDSITAGTFQTLDINYARRIIPGLALPMNVSVDGRFGTSIAALDAAFASGVNVSGAYNPLATNNIMTIFAGTNDITGGATGAVTWAHLASFAAQARAAGWKVALTTMLPRAGLTTPQQAEWATYNSLIRANWASTADALIDAQADDVIGPFAAASNGALYADGIHPADGIPIYFTNQFITQINSLLR